MPLLVFIISSALDEDRGFRGKQIYKLHAVTAWSRSARKIDCSTSVVCKVDELASALGKSFPVVLA
jgi:hypothetical protein